jgi:hypothetical protein
MNRCRRCSANMRLSIPISARSIRGYTQQENKIKAIGYQIMPRWKKRTIYPLYREVHAKRSWVCRSDGQILGSLATARSRLFQWIQQLDMWLVRPLPGGHNVVTSNMDTSIVKQADNNLNGIFVFSPLVGYDIDGVDINRNRASNSGHTETLSCIR